MITPVEDFIRFFSHFTDTQLLDPNYALSSAHRLGSHCKLCDALIASEPLGEIGALVSDCFSHLVSTPHLVVRINTSLYEAARERIELLAKQSGFAGRLVILAEPEIETGDCRIEWADGGVVLERAAVEAKINELVGRYMTSRGQAKTTAMGIEP